uniref:Preprosubtilisine n=1 Tax=Thermococcus sp. AMT11 TaxID=563043 RepID=C8BNC1_9EURY|nr:preprosubtilisine [Thermococcus sp. AMT11]
MRRPSFAIQKWRADLPAGMKETNTGIWVPDNFWDWVTGSVQATANLTEMAFKWLQTFNEKVQNDEPVPWIIVTWRDPNERFVQALEKIGFTIQYVDHGINAVSIIGKPSTVKNLAYSNSFDFPYRFYIKEIWPDLYIENSPYQVENVSAQVIDANITPEVVQNAAWDIKVIQADLVWSKEGITGKGVVVAVVDTGVDCDHVMLEGACVGFANFVSNEPAKDLNGHGTHVAGTVAGRPVKARVDGQDVYISGVAPGASILAVKVLGRDGSGSMTQIIQGLDYVIQYKRKHPDEKIIVSMSLGSPFGSPNDPMVRKVEQLVNEEHIPAVIAAGNEFVLIDSPGIAPHAITVAAVDRNLKVADFSGKGPGITAVQDIKPDIAAPGVKIISARAGTKDGLIAMSGTSMATPHVSGVAALVLQAKDIHTPDTLKGLLTATAKPLDAPVTWAGAGLVDAYAAVKAEPPDEGFWAWLRRWLS